MRTALMPTYAPPDIEFEYGKGSYLYTKKGRRYLDFTGGIAVNSFGHVHPYLCKALITQVEKLWHISNVFRVPQAESLATRLVESSCADRVFFCNSGAEAVECGLKVMRRYQFEQGRPERRRIIGFSNAFHGRTIATVGAAGNSEHMRGFVGPDDGFLNLPFGDLQALEKHLDDTMAGIIVEPVQGEGGIIPAESEFLHGLRDFCTLHDLPLMFDEVQCGMGRTGHLFAYQFYGIEPDVIALAKGMGGGFPVGACLAKEKFSKFMVVGTHGSTFGGNPLAMTVANAVLDLLQEEGRLEMIRARGESLLAHLKELVKTYPHVFSEARGIGLMLGLRCTVPNIELLTDLQNQGLLLVKAGDNVLRLLPPLNVNGVEEDEAIGILYRVASTRGC